MTARLIELHKHNTTTDNQTERFEDTELVVTRGRCKSFILFQSFTALSHVLVGTDFRWSRCAAVLESIFLIVFRRTCVSSTSPGTLADWGIVYRAQALISRRRSGVFWCRVTFRCALCPPLFPTFGATGWSFSLRSGRLCMARDIRGCWLANRVIRFADFTVRRRLRCVLVRHASTSLFGFFWFSLIWFSVQW